MLGYEQRLYSLDRDHIGRADQPSAAAAAAAAATPDRAGAAAAVAGAVNPQVARLAWNMKEHSQTKRALNVSRNPAEAETVLVELQRFISTGPGDSRTLLLSIDCAHTYGRCAWRRAWPRTYFSGGGMLGLPCW